MLQAIRMLFLIGAVLLFLGTGAFAAEVAVNGTVASYDPVTHTITLTDGRVMTVEPASKILIDGREVAVTEVRPGSVIVLMPPSGVPGAVVPPAPRSTPYSATAGSVKGTVQYVDPVAKTIIFNDGTLVQLEPNSRIFVNGKEVALAELRPGAVAVLSSPAPAVRAIPAPSPAVAPPASLSRSASPVEVSGTVASVDRQNGLITFRDGRVVRASEGDVWQHVRMSSIQPGADVLVSNAMPVGFGAAAAPSPSWAESNMMGRVTSIDPTGREVVLSDGRVVAVSPSTQVQLAGGKPATIAELRPGDQVVIQTRQSPGAAGVAGARASIDAAQIVIVRKAEAP